MRSSTKRIKQELANNHAIDLCAKQCGVIGDLNKLKICYLLRNYPELSVTDIAELVGTSVSNTSHSLRKLRNANLVQARKQAQTVYYSLRTNAFENVLNVIGG